jgi:ankyrin repeat protein
MYKTVKKMKYRRIRILEDCIELFEPRESIRSSITDEDGCTSLMNACKQGDLPMVQRSIQLDDMNYQDEDGWTALMYAVYHNHLPVVLYLIQEGVNPHIKTNNGKTARWLAYTENHSNIIHVLDSYLVAQSSKRNELFVSGTF